jgi:hypothetical protein
VLIFLLVCSFRQSALPLIFTRAFSSPVRFPEC